MLVDKPAGPTSHDVVETVRRALRVRRVGHLGTLDPFATGLLVLLVGRATRLAACAGDWVKEYEGTIRLGVETATDDVTGAVTTTSEAWRDLGPEEVHAAAGRFVGVLEQRPPAYSAKKVAGERAYRRARRGEAVALAPVRVEIRELEVVAVALPEVRFRAVVSGGTYLRALARDLGQGLGCGGHLVALRRTAVGPYQVGEATSLEALAAGPAPFRPPEELVRSLPRMDLDGPAYEAVRHGRPINGGEGSGDGGRVALFAEGRLLAVAEREGTLLKPKVVLEG